jgi:hypothetical protein
MLRGLLGVLNHAFHSLVERSFSPRASARAV